MTAPGRAGVEYAASTHSIGKGAHPNADRNRVTPFDIASDLHDSLARLRTGYIDLYLLHQPVDVFPLVGCQTPDEWRANAEAFDLALTPDELAWVNLEKD